MIYYSHVNDDNSAERLYYQNHPASNLITIAGSGECIMAMVGFDHLDVIKAVDNIFEALYLPALKRALLTQFATVIFAIGYATTVDDTLQLIIRFQLEKKKSSKSYQAIMDTMDQPGRPLIMTSMILFGGFAILMHSSFGDLFMHCFLFSKIVATGLISELLMTPILIIYFYKERQNIHG